MRYPGPFTRREWVRHAGLSLLAGSVCRDAVGKETWREAWGDRHCIFIMLQGGPSHIDLWDPKPLASEDIRGPWGTIRSQVPGVALGELLPQMAARMDRLAIIRSMTHGFTNHIAGTYVTMTGSDNQPDQDREAHADDFPGPGAILNYLPLPPAKVPRSVSLPNWLSIPGPSNRMPGQYAGLLGSEHDPFLIAGDPNTDHYDPLGLNAKNRSLVTSHRMTQRTELLRSIDQMQRPIEPEWLAQDARLRQSALDLVTDGRVRHALDLQTEAAAVRDRYGRNALGQTLLVARRLVEAGVQFVSCNEFNQKWDTHGGLLGRYQQIVPPLDQAFAALIDDLHERGLAERTLVILGGEFGRTPRVNHLAGRDHWPNAYSLVMAGGGVQGGAVWGQTDRQGAEVLTDRVHPADVLATMWHHLQIPTQTVLVDRLKRPHLLSSGHVVRGIFG